MAFREQRLAARSTLYDVPSESGLLSFVTTAWNTKPDYLRALADSLLPQLVRHQQEWVLLDNGSDAVDTINLLKMLGQQPGVVLLRAKENLGIIGGMRHCLEQAKGRYIVPVDSDDYLYPDCIRMLNGFLRQHAYPALIYTDEDKLEGSRFFQPYFKPDWDPVLFVNSCYIAHLGAIDRKRAISLGVYTDPSVEGCHDWDTFMRFYLAGHEPAHLPDVLYSWRLHPQSTSAHIDSKAYIHSSHHAVLSRFLENRAPSGHFDLELSPLFNGSPDRRFRRKFQAPRSMLSVVFQSGGEDRKGVTVLPPDYPGAGVILLPPASSAIALQAAAERALAAGALLHLLWDRTVPAGAEWPWEALGLFELFSDTVMVGGRISGTDGRIRTAGRYFGFGDGCGCPDKGRARSDPGYFAQMWKPHSVSAVLAQHAVVDPAFLLETLSTIDGATVSPAYLGAWLGAHARRSGKRVIYTPFLEAQCDDDWEATIEDEEIRTFNHRFTDLLPDTQLLSPRLGLSPGTAYAGTSDELRQSHLVDLAAGAMRRSSGGRLSLPEKLE